MKIRSKLILSAVAATLGCALLAGCGGAASSSTASSASPAASSVVLSQAESALPDDGTNSPDALADEVMRCWKPIPSPTSSRSLP